jgi:hypothetical protein
MALSSGAAPQRGLRKSQLLLNWKSRLCSLVADTGQVGVFTPFFSGVNAPGNVLGRNGTPIVAGHGQPRWEQHADSGNITRLLLEGEVPLRQSENVVMPWPLKVSAIALEWLVWPMYAPGENIGSAAYGPMIGTATTGGGWFGIRRLGTDWHAVRKRGGVEIVSAVTDIGSVFPIYVLATLGLGGVLTISTRDATTQVRTGASTTDANMLIATETWGNSQFSFCGVQGLVAPGGRWRYELLKVPRGVKTFPQLDLMS